MVVASLIFLIEKYHRLFPLPPSSTEHSEYTEQYEPIKELGSDVGDSSNASRAYQHTTSEKRESLKQSFINRKRDLNAQEGMWRAANYLAVLAFLQFLATILTILYIYRTFRVQKDELDETKRANIAMLKPYLAFKAIGETARILTPNSNMAYPPNPPEEHCWFEISVAVRNNGATPANDMHLSFLGGNSSSINLRRIGPTRAHYQWTTFRTESIEGTIDIVMAKKKRRGHFSGYWRTDCPLWIIDRRLNDDETMSRIYAVDRIHLNHFQARFKDIEYTQDSPVHRMMEGTYLMRADEVRIGMDRNEPERDDKHPYFARLAHNRKSRLAELVAEP